VAAPAAADLRKLTRGAHFGPCCNLLEDTREPAPELRARRVSAGARAQVGVVGMCMGGALALLAAEHAKIDAAASFYGTPAGHKELSHVRRQRSQTRVI
jgi:dienelactone hydrolase